jgi:uncharacterized protein
MPTAGRCLLLAMALFLAAGPALSALDVPALKGRVNDYADMISASAEQAIAQKLETLETSDSTQVVVLTIPSLDGEDLEGFSIQVAEAWKIGTAEHDNGAILVVARDDRAVRIEVGYGLEGKLTDLLSGRIIREIILPNFKAGRFDEGFLQAVDAIIAAVEGEYTGTGQLPGEKGEPMSRALPLIIAAFIAGSIGSRRRIFGGIAGAVLVPLASMIAFPVGWLTLIWVPLGFGGGLLAASLLASRISGRGGRGGGFSPGGFGGYTGGGFRGGGGSGGSGFSGGGGGFGGGGATGHW